MARIVVKYGGTSVGDPRRIESAAEKVAMEIRRGHEVVVVVSAMAGVTNQLVDYCHQISTEHPAEEYDMVVASGEQVTSGLMAIALQKRGFKSRSYAGWQVPLICSDQHGRARIDEVPPENLEAALSEKIIPVVAGFQGVSRSNRISTLGRGGSDTTAVALAAALKADRCDIYTDVDGVYTTDPRLVPEAQKLSKVSYEEMLEMAALGAKVLHPRSVELAMAHEVPLQVLSSFGPDIGSDTPGTLIVSEENIMEKQIVNGVAFTRNEAKITILGVPDSPGTAAAIFDPLCESGINVDVIVQNISANGTTADMTFTVPKLDAVKTLRLLESLPFSSQSQVRVDKQIAKVSIIGIGMSSHSGVARTMFRTLADNHINIQAITTSEIKISVLIDELHTEKAVKVLHAAFGLAQEEMRATGS